MPRDWMHGEPGRDEGRGDERRARREHERRDDFGQADFTRDYRYDPERRAAYRVAEEEVERDDYGQADYSNDYGYDREHGRGYRRFSGGDRGPDTSPDADRRYGRRMDEGEYRRSDPRDRGPGERNRSFMDRAGALFGGAREEERVPPRRRGPSDRVLWAVIVERLEDERGLDLRDVEVLVEDADVTLNGTVRRKEDKRRIEDVADIQGVRNVQNNLRVRDRRWFG